MLTTLQAARYTVRGMSLGGVYTSIHVPELDALFDCGFPLRASAAVTNLFLSHGHVDHVGSLPALLGIRGLHGVRKNLRIFLPSALGPAVEEALAVISRLHRWPLTVDLVPMEPGQEVHLRNDLNVRAFKTYHPVPSLGYLFINRVKKLLPQYAALPGDEIGRLRRTGAEIFREEPRFELAYATDTLPTVLDREPALFDTRVLILECTFLDQKKSVADARAGCHIHLDELLPYAHRFRNEALVLMHFSQLYSPADVRRILAERCPPEMRRILRAFAPETESWPG